MNDDLSENQQSGSSASNSRKSNETHTQEWEILEKLALGSLAEQAKTHRWSVIFKGLTFAYLLVLLLMLYPWGDVSMPFSDDEQHTAVVSILGMIASEEQANAPHVIKGLRKAFEDEDTKGIILNINSGGGSPVQSGYIYDEINRLRALHEDIKVYAVISDTGASGAYYIASAADEIWAEKASLVGSIGVVSSDFGFVEAMQKVGIERRIFTAGENKAFLDSYSPLEPSHLEFWDDMLGVIHRQFIDSVKAGRGDRIKDDPVIFSGLIWTGEQALELGLVDGLGSAGHVAREIIGAEKLVDFSIAPHPIDKLIKQFGISVGYSIVQQLLLADKLPTIH